MAKRKTKKKAWKDFEITKVKLNPEQAVLSRCNGVQTLAERTAYECQVLGTACAGKSAAPDLANS